MTEQQKQAFTEAPASWNIRYRVNGFDEQLTLRGGSFASIKDQVDAARDYVRTHFAPDAKATVAAINTDVSPQPEAQSAPVAAQKPIANGATVKVIHAARMEVEPRTDGKSKLKFFEQGHKFPDIDTVRTPEKLAQLLSNTGEWTPEHFGAAASYEVNYVIEWRDSENVNSKGNPYKNIVSVKPS